MATEATGGNGAVDIREAILSELASGGETKADVAVEAAADDESADEVEAASQDETVEEVEAASDEDTETEAEEVEVTDDEADEDEDADLKSDDPETQKRLDQVRRAEKRMREAEARRDADFAEKQRKWQQQVDRVAEIDKLAARVKYDPIPVLRALGVSDEDLVSIAQAAYAESPEGQKDPARKAAALQRLKEREKEDKLSATEKRIAELEQRIEKQQAEAKAQAEAQRYIAEINTAATTKHPLVANLLKTDPEETTDRLVATYNALGQKLGRAPKATEVVAEYDRKERARLTKLGVDLSKYTKPAAKVATKPGAKPVVAAKPAANTNGAKKAPVDERDAIVAELAQLKEQQLS